MCTFRRLKQKRYILIWLKLIISFNELTVTFASSWKPVYLLLREKTHPWRGKTHSPGQHVNSTHLMNLGCAYSSHILLSKTDRSGVWNSLKKDIRINACLNSPPGMKIWNVVWKLDIQPHDKSIRKKSCSRNVIYSTSVIFLFLNSNWPLLS